MLFKKVSQERSSEEEKTEESPFSELTGYLQNGIVEFKEEE